MQRISIRLLVASTTFCAGVAIAAVWIAGQTPQIDPVPLLESPQPVLHSQCFPGFGDKVDLLRPSEGGYFPEEPPCSDLRATYFFSFYTDRLKQLGEPTLLTEGHTAYRFLWLRSFHPPVAVRLWLDGENKMLSVKELSPSLSDENESSTLLVNQTRSLTPEEWATFVRLLDASCFWGMPSSSNSPIAEDGAWWVLEGVQEGYYHVTHRQSPASDPYRELCLYMLKLSGLPLDETKGEIY